MLKKVAPAGLEGSAIDVWPLDYFQP